MAGRSFKQTHHAQSGFTLLEVIMSITILLSISLAATQMIRTSINMREAISESSQVNHRLAVVMQRVVADIQHSFLISTLRPEYNFGGRATKATFKMKRGSGDNTELALTTMNHEAVMANSHQSDQSYVLYRLEEDKYNRDVMNLYRGETKVLPTSFSEDPPMMLFARNIKSFKVYPWTGETWEKDRWDTDRADWRNMLPQMVMVEVEAYEEENQAESGRLDAGRDKPTVRMNTVVYLPQSYGMKEPKERSKSLKWYN